MRIGVRRLSRVMSSIRGPNRFRFWLWPPVKPSDDRNSTKIVASVSLHSVRLCLSVCVFSGVRMFMVAFLTLCVCVDGFGLYPVFMCVWVEYATSCFLGMACAHECHCLNYLDGVHFPLNLRALHRGPVHGSFFSPSSSRRELPDGFWWGTRRPKNNTSICRYTRGPGVCHGKWFLMIGLIVSQVRSTHTPTIMNGKPIRSFHFPFPHKVLSHIFTQSVWLWDGHFKGRFNSFM